MKYRVKLPTFATMEVEEINSIAAIRQAKKEFKQIVDLLNIDWVTDDANDSLIEIQELVEA